jgi:hypothetical protein
VLKESFVEAPAETTTEQLDPKILRRAEILEKAADIIDTDGWTRGNLRRGERRCAVGAISKAAGIDGQYPSSQTPAAWGAVKALGDVVSPNRSHYAEVVDRVTSWNDARARTAKEVSRKLREAAARLLQR